MGADLTIWETRQGDNIDEVIYKRITTVYNWEVIEKLQNMGRKNWYVDSECGAVFELTGEELNSIIDLLQFEDNRLIGKTFDNDEWFRCNLSF